MIRAAKPFPSVWILAATEELDITPKTAASIGPPLSPEPRSIFPMLYISNISNLDRIFSAEAAGQCVLLEI
jgi:hypothetical protein